jgi:hypothetical protein
LVVSSKLSAPQVLDLGETGYPATVNRFEDNISSSAALTGLCIYLFGSPKSIEIIGKILKSCGYCASTSSSACTSLSYAG